ncbi:MAG: hypothetical protein ACFFAO_08695, partial [Candidatus Hermodarchaeota archaeon]
RLNYQKFFDFSVHVDALNDPVFSNGAGKILNCSDILKVMNNGSDNELKLQEKEKNSEIKKELEIQGIEQYTFEKLFDKQALWGGVETKTFKKWKEKVTSKYRNETGKTSYYKGKPTKNYEKYLENLYDKKPNKKKKAKPKKSSTSKPSKSSKKPKNIKSEISENFVFEILKGKKAHWGGSETKSFQTWKIRTAKKYHKEEGRKTHYQGKLTKNYQLYLAKLINGKAQ